MPTSHQETKVMSSAPADVPCTERDLYGQSHPIESPELIAAKLKAFEEEVAKISDEEKPCLSKAQEKCPKLLNDDFKLMFLRCEVFNADVSASLAIVTWHRHNQTVFLHLKSNISLSARCETVLSLLGAKSLGFWRRAGF